MFVGDDGGQWQIYSIQKSAY